SDQVLTISLHESGRFLFPGTGEVADLGVGKGRGYAVNLPLYPHTDDEIYLWAFREIVPPLVRVFAPDVLVTQLGCDTHYRDPLTHLMLSLQGYSQVVQELRPLAKRWLALGGGGYDIEVVARAWTLAYTIQLEKELPPDIPQSFQDKYGIKYLYDTEPVPPQPHRKQQAWQFSQRQVGDIKRLIFPLYSL
ncbi:MAG: acetoin utilization protein AcuC, partial [Chloroflexota bacterium]